MLPLVFNQFDYYLALLVKLVVFTYLVRYIISKIQHSKILPKNQLIGKVVVISGCDSGFGSAIALKMANDGFYVFAGCLDASKSDLDNNHQIQTLQMDVTSQDQMMQSVGRVEEFLKSNTGKYQLWAVIANAGLTASGHVEMAPMATFDRIVSVNICGSVRLFHSFLPVLRTQNNGGRLIAMCSFVVNLPTPGQAAYCCSKTGLSCFLDCLRLEIHRFGIKVCSIYPDAYSTPMVANLSQKHADVSKEMALKNELTFEAYGGHRAASKSVNFLAKVSSMARTDLTPVLDAVDHAATAVNPREKYFPINIGSHLLLCFVAWFPGVFQFACKILTP